MLKNSKQRNSESKKDIKTFNWLNPNLRIGEVTNFSLYSNVKDILLLEKFLTHSISQLFCYSYIRVLTVDFALDISCEIHYICFLFGLLIVAYFGPIGDKCSVTLFLYILLNSIFYYLDMQLTNDKLISNDVQINSTSWTDVSKLLCYVFALSLVVVVKILLLIWK